MSVGEERFQDLWSLKRCRRVYSNLQSRDRQGAVTPSTYPIPLSGTISELAPPSRGGHSPLWHSAGTIVEMGAKYKMNL